jgi:peptide/nickel transport system substrate-binding protein
VRTTKRSARYAALAVGLAFIAAACGSDNKGSSATTAAPGTTAAAPATTEAAPVTTAATATTAGGTETTGGSSGGAAMTLTMEINPKAVWDDGSPITVADFKCLYDATINTPGSLSTVGYDKITSIDQGKDDHEVVVKFSEVYAPYKNLFAGILKASAVSNCKDVSADFKDNIPFSARPYKIDSWSLDQLVLSKNAGYFGDDAGKTDQIVMVPKADSDTEIASLVSGESDFIFPQAYAGITDALNDPNIKYTPGYGTNYEGLYFQEDTNCTPDETRSCAFKDADFRKAFAKSIDRNLIRDNIYDPIFPGGPLLNCGLWVPTIGKWCDDTVFGTADGKDGYFDSAGAEKILTDAGWAKDASGMWAKDGNVPEVHWIINSGNTRRESTQALLIPELKKAGFNVIADNCDAACYFQQRLPALKYDMAMYINTASPDPTVTGIMSCDAVPSAANGNQGQNSTGWCNKDASALMTQSDQTIDETKRIDLIHQIAKYLADDAVMLPLYQFPNIAAWRTDQVGGPVDQDAANYQAFQNINQWEDTNGDGKIVIGAEQWPECLNPITECANSSWYVWTTAFKVLPNVWDTTSDGNYVATNLVTGEPDVSVG